MDKFKTFVDKHHAILTVSSVIIGVAALQYAATIAAVNATTIAKVDLDDNVRKVRVTFRNGKTEYYS
jgi:hypothetical protein